MTVLNENHPLADTASDDESLTAWSRIAADVPAPTEVDPNAGFMSDETLAAMIRSAGFDPKNYSAPQPLPELPGKLYLRQTLDETGLSEHDLRFLYNRGDDAERIRMAAAVGGPIAAERVTRQLYATKVERSVDDLVFPADDNEKIAAGLGGPIRLEWVEELQKTPEGKKRLERLWSKAQVRHISAQTAPEYLMYEAEAISSSDLVLTADVRRLGEDVFGGTGRAGINLGKDFLSGAARMVNQGFWWSANTAARGLQALGPDVTIIRGRYPWGPLTEAETAALETDLGRKAPILEAVEYTQESAGIGNDFYYRPESRTGDVVYDKLASPVAGGLGTVLSSIATFAINPALGWAVMYGAGKGEIYNQARAADLDESTSHAVSDVGAVFMALLERAGAESVVKSWTANSPAGQAIISSLVAPFVGEGITEASQSLVGGAATEVGLAGQPEYEFSWDRVTDYLRDAMVEGFYGGVTGGIAGAGGSNWLRTAGREYYYRADQRFLSGGIERLAKAPGLRKAPEKLKRIADDIIEKSGVTQTRFMDADRFQSYFQGDISRMEAAMADLDVTRQQLDHALAAGSQIEVSTSGLMRHCAARQQDTDLHRLARAQPDAPTIEMILQEKETAAAAAEEFNRISRENQTLPEPFRIIRQELVDAGHPSSQAQHETDMIYAMSKVAGARIGLTAEQFIDLNPIQVTLANSMNRVRSYGEVAARNEDARYDRASRAAQDAYVRHQSGADPVRAFVDSTSGTPDFGVVSEAMAATPEAQAAGLVPGLVRVQEGLHDTGKPRGHQGFGLRHLADRLGLLKNGANEAEALVEAKRFVEDVVTNPDAAYDVAAGRFGLVKKDGNNRLVVMELMREEIDGQPVYTVITGGVRRKISNKYKLLWAKGSDSATPPDSASSLSGPGVETSGAAVPRELGAKADTSTIPAETVDVNQAAQPSLNDLLAQSGVRDEQAEAFVRYARSLTEDGGDLSSLDARALGREVQAASIAAEGLEQAAAGLERVIADPARVTQAVFDALGITAPTFQEGIAEAQRLVTDRRRRAEQFRNFYQDADLIRQVREADRLAQDLGQRADVTLAPEVSTVRLFNNRQDESSFMHEAFHIFFRHFEKAAMASDADSQTRRDYIRLNEELGGGLFSTDPEVRRAAEERAATMHEKYLSEGVAPSPFLADAFRRFRTWITSVYRQVDAFAGVELSDDVRAIFGRMLAGEAEMDHARQYYNDLEILTPPAAASEEVKRGLNERAARARATAEERHVARIVKEYFDSTGRREEIRRLAREEVTRQRPYVTARALKAMGGMTREQVANEIGDAMADKLAGNHPGIVRKELKKRRDNSQRLARLIREEVAVTEDGMAVLARDFQSLPGQAARAGFSSVEDLVEAIVDKGMHQGLAARIANLGGLDQFLVQRMHGTEAVDTLRERFGDRIFTAENGETGAILAAERLGYDSVGNMLSEVANAPKLENAIKARADAMTAAEEADIRRVALEDAATPADEDYHDDAHSEYFAAKQRVLDSLAAEQAEREGKRAHRMLSGMAIRAAAAYNNSQKSGRKAGQYHVETAAFKRHGMNATRAEAAGDYVTAAREWQFMQMAHHGIKEAIAARRRLDAFQKRHGRVNAVLARLEGRNRNRSAPVEAKFREAIRDISTTFKITDAYRMRPEGPIAEQIAIPGHDPDKSVEAASMLPSMAASIPQWIVDRRGAENLRSWRDLTMERIDELNEALNSLEKQGRGELHALRQPGIATREQLKRDSIKRMSPLPTRSKVLGRPGEGDTFKNKLLRGLEKIGLDNYIPEYIFAMADGNTNITGKGIGPLQNLAIALRDGASRKSELVAATLGTINPALHVLAGYRERFANMDKAALGPVPQGLVTAYGSTAWTGEMAVMFAYNSGNAGNLKALLEGYGVSRQQWQSILSTFTDAELDAVQTIWDAIGEYFPRIDEVTFRMVNRHVRRVEAQPLTVVRPDGSEKTLDGGYFPLIFDALVNASAGAAQQIELSMNKAHFDAIHTLARLANSFTIERATDEEGQSVVKRSPKLDSDILTTHIDKVAHYVALADAVHEADLLTVDEEWAGVFISRFGQPTYGALRKWIKYVADPDAGNMGDGSLWGKSLMWMRHKATVAALGFRFWTAMKQRLDYFPAALHMSLHSRTGASGFAYLIRGMREIGWSGNLGRMNARIEEIYGKSAFMKNRDGNVTADMREIVSRAMGKQKVFDIAGIRFTNTDMYNLAFKFMTTQDRAAASAVWAGMYRMAMDGNGSFDPAGMSVADIEAAAIRDADMAAATFASTTIADLTEAQRNTFMRPFTTFITGTIRRTSRLRQYADAVQRGQMSKARFLQVFVLDAALQVWTPGFMYLGLKALTGDDDEKPSMWDWMSTLFLEPTLTFVDGMPGLNTLSSIARRGANGAFTPAGQREAERQIRQLVSAPGDIAKGDYNKALWKAIAIGGYAKGIPVEAPLRDLEKALQTVGVMEKDKR